MTKGVWRADTCEIPGCTAPHFARGWCSAHWKRWKRNGDPLGGRPTFRTVADRFFAKVGDETETGCWPWLGTKTRFGYGMFSLNGGLKLAHRVAYELLIEPIPDGLTCDHLCRVRHCVNPTHIELVTGAENTRRGKAAKTHCPHGHPYDETNTAYRVDGARICRTCRNTESRERKRRARLGRVS